MRRYTPPSRADLLKLIAERQKREALAPLLARQNELARTLDALNAYDALELIRRKRFNVTTCFGPRPLYGLAPSPWVGVLIWQKAPGYYGYKTLTLYGVWARDAAPPPEGDAKPVEIVIGRKPIPYTSDFYVAEAYFKLIRDGFDAYYADDGRPPAHPDSLLIYDAAKRLEQRTTLVGLLARLA